HRHTCGGRMTGPPAARPHESNRLSPANGIPLLNDQYDLRGSDGLLICRVSRERAEQGIRAGQLELRQGRAGAYLSPTQKTPVNRERRTSTSPRTWLGPHEPGQGAPTMYAHNAPVCNAYPTESPAHPQYWRRHLRDAKRSREALRASKAAD